MICIIIKNSIIRICNISSRMGDQGKPDFPIGKISTKFKFSRQKIFRFDHVTCRGCCGCYGWDNFDPKAVSESLKQMLHMKTKIIALSHSRLEWRLAENGSKILFLWHHWIFTIWPCDLSRLLWLLRLRYFWSESCFWKFEANAQNENKNHCPISFVARMAAGRKWIKNPVFMAQLNFYDLTVWLVEAAVAATVEIISIRKLFLKVWSNCSKWKQESLPYLICG